MGDPEIEAGLAASYQVADSPWEKPFNQEESAYIADPKPRVLPL